MRGDVDGINRSTGSCLPRIYAAERGRARVRERIYTMMMPTTMTTMTTDRYDRDPPLRN